MLQKTKICKYHCPSPAHYLLLLGINVFSLKAKGIARSQIDDSTCLKRRQNSNQCSKGAISRSFIFANFVVKMVPSRQNWILTWIIEVHFFDKTNGLGAIRFLVLAAKPLVLSKNLTSQTPIKIQFYVLDTIFESKKSKITCIDTILGMWKFTQNLP